MGVVPGLCGPNEVCEHMGSLRREHTFGVELKAKGWVVHMLNGHNLARAGSGTYAETGRKCGGVSLE